MNLSNSTNENWPQLQCPSCKGLLITSKEPFFCEACKREWGSSKGIPLFFLNSPDLDIPDHLFDVLYSLENKGHFIFWGRNQALLHILSDSVHGKSGLKILDIGCGTGYTLAPFQKLGARVAGVDVALRVLQYTPKRGIKHVYGACASDLPFSDGQFNLTISQDVFEHIEDDAAAMREAWRVLEPGGKLVVFVPALPILWNRYDEYIGHKRRYSKVELKNKLVEAGFIIERMTYLFPTFLIPTFIVRFVSRILISEKKSKEAVLAELVMPPFGLNAILKFIAWIEACIVSKFNFPIGITLAAVASKSNKME